VKRKNDVKEQIGANLYALLGVEVASE